MPKVVDASERRAVIIEATFRLIHRCGLESASLRNVATESELNVGSVRHYFDSHSELLRAAAEEMARRISSRVEVPGRRLQQAVVADDPRAILTAAISVYAELLPLDERRRRECAVWLAFVEHSRTRPELAAECAVEQEQMMRPTTALMRALGREPAVDWAEQLFAGVNGLTVNALLMPERYSVRRQRRLLRQLMSSCLGSSG